MAHVLKGSHSFTCAPRVHPLTEWTIPTFAFPAEAGTHFPTPEGWKAELAVAGWLHTEINVRHREINQDTVAHRVAIFLILYGVLAVTTDFMSP